MISSAGQPKNLHELHPLITGATSTSGTTPNSSPFASPASATSHSSSGVSHSRSGGSTALITSSSANAGAPTHYTMRQLHHSGDARIAVGSAASSVAIDMHSSVRNTSPPLGPSGSSAGVDIHRHSLGTDHGHSSDGETTPIKASSGGGKPLSSQATSTIADGIIKQSHTSNAEIIAVILFYSGISLSIVYFNWWLFTSSFEFPVFVSWFQQVIGVFIFICFAALGNWFSCLSHFPCIIPNMRTAIKVLPLAVNFVLMVAFANLCLKYVQVSTYQVARSLTILFTIILSYGILGHTQSHPVIFACGVMVLGFIIGSLDPSTLSLGGVITGACSSVFQALYNVIIKTTLSHVDNNTNVMLFYNQLLSSLLFLPVVYLSGELSGVVKELPTSLSDPKFFSVWPSLCLSGLLAALMNLAAYLCVKMTSPLTFNIVGFTKSLLQSLGGVVFLGDVVSIQSLGGIFLSLCGSAWYSRIKMVEGAQTMASSKLGIKDDAVVIETGLRTGATGVDGSDGTVRVVVSTNPLMTGGQEEMQPLAAAGSADDAEIGGGALAGGATRVRGENHMAARKTQMTANIRV